MTWWNRYRELWSGKAAGFTKRACIILLMVVPFLGNTLAHAHSAHEPAPTALSHQFSGLPSKTENGLAKHHSIACSCLSTVLPRDCAHGLPVLETAAVKYPLDKGFARRSVGAWDLDPPPRA